MSVTIYTIGHSTRTLAEFLDLLRAHGVQTVIDVRRYPGSRRHPQFGSESLELSLRAEGFGYRHAIELGGRRTPNKSSPHTAWRSASFRAYADYMDTAAFQQELRRLIDAAATERQAIMCAEAVPWRCHRQLIADALTARGVEVRHILTATREDLHVLSEHAVVTGDSRVAYPDPADAQTDLGLPG